ncbi:MAG: MarR family transcriptional regulator [Rickettsiales bacterium]|nr:MarR family transcriptional regulator [Rickettsiales bacterium]
MQKQQYIETILLIERMHRRFLDVIKTELDRLKVDDLNNVQTLILYNINAEELTIGELTNRGYYLGSNVSYNVKKLVENGYLEQERSTHDKRSVKIKLSGKGLAICEKIDALYEKHVSDLAKSGPSESEIDTTKKALLDMERYWSSVMASLYKLA